MFKIKEMLEKILLRHNVPFGVDEKGVYTIFEGGREYSIHCYEECIIVRDNEFGNEFEYTNWLMLDENIRRVSKGGGFRVDFDKEFDELHQIMWCNIDDEEYYKEKFELEMMLKMIDEEFERSKDDIEKCGVSIVEYCQEEENRVVQKMLSGATSHKELEEIKEILIDRLV